MAYYSIIRETAFGRQYSTLPDEIFRVNSKEHAETLELFENNVPKLH